MLRIALCAALVWIASSWIDSSGAWLLLEDAALALLYLVLLLLVREVKREELEASLRALRPVRG